MFVKTASLLEIDVVEVFEPDPITEDTGNQLASVLFLLPRTKDNKITHAYKN